MKHPQKISIRFFDDREVRALWDETNAKWWFSVLDIIAVLTNQDDYSKTRNYWKYLKAKLKKGGSQVVSDTTQLGNMLKEPTHIQAHLVFADTQSPNKKPKELEFCQRTTETE